MKLKTLKDCVIEEKNETGFPCYFPVKLKKEAIKWIKELEKLKILNDDKIMNIDGYNYSFSMLCGAVLFAKQFFNIKEDEIK